MSIITRSTTHDCYDHYELKTYSKMFNCDGCRMKGYGERYTCNLCGHELHKECRHPSRTITHEYFPGSTFEFLKEPFTKFDRKGRRIFSKCCDACGKDICGFSYHCEEDNLDLHPCCRKLEKKLVIDGMVFDLVTKVSSKCGKCGKKKVSRDEKFVLGWSYISQCKKYRFHVYCISEMIHEAYMKHGDLALENIDLRELVRSNRNRDGGNALIGTIKLFIKMLLSALLGDPTMFASNVVVELFSRGMQY